MPKHASYQEKVFPTNKDPSDSISLQTKQENFLRNADSEALSQSHPFGKGDIEERTLLGSGGMAEIRLGYQHSLQRSVALKKPLPGHTDPMQMMSLLQEGLITSVLEHPGIVPVYDLTLNDQQQPMLVMKYIQGRPWTEQLRERPVPTSEEWEVWFEEQIRIFCKVCNAVHFAHSRGIIHRDLKPENVMVGDFGEVYLLDWGIAVSLYEDESSLFPLASEQDCIAGTPAYMAPEQTRPELLPLSEKTDVYLLGAVLFEILTGAPPHQSSSLRESLRRAYSNDEWDLPEEVPWFLNEICRRAMESLPENRFDSADLLQQKLQGYFDYRDSMRLVDSTDRELLELEVLLEQSEDWENLDDEVRVKLQQSFERCQFGYSQAHELWPWNENAKEGLQNTLELRIQLALSDNSSRQAELYYAQLPSPNPSLKASLEILRDSRLRQTHEIESFRKMQEEHSPRIGLNLRFQIQFQASMFLVLMAWSHLFLGWFAKRPYRVSELTLAWVAFSLFVVWKHWRNRITVSATLLNRVFLKMTYAMLCLFFLLHLFAFVFQKDGSFLLQTGTLLLAVFFSLLVIFFEAPTKPLAGVLWGSFLLGLFFQNNTALLSAITFTCLSAILLTIHRNIRDRIDNDALLFD